MGFEGPAQHPYVGMLALGVKQDPGAWHADPKPNKTSCFFPLQWDVLWQRFQKGKLFLMDAL